MNEQISLALHQMVEGDVADMNETFKNVLSQKAGQKLEEKKQEIGQAYFGKK